MFSLLPPSHPDELPRERPRPTLAALQRRISFIEPSLQVGSPSYEAALILLSAEAIGQNIDRLARFSGVPRQTVARCARRLVDNGVWRDGNIVSHWCDNPDDVESFRSDVGVADGTLCRRVGEDGTIEWAPQGYWRKHYEYTDPRREELPQVVSYQPHVEMAEQTLPYVDDDEDDEEEVLDRSSDWVERSLPKEVAVTTETSVWLGGDDAGAVESSGSWLGSVPAVGAELFPDATWLG